MGDLPPIPGPKLAAFKGKSSTLDIDFIQFIGSGLHAHVWKVKIDGDIYALQMFKFGNDFTPASFFDVKLSKEDEVLYMHPFNCEARAYARLQEAKREDIAIPCHGYIMLDQEQQKALREKDTDHDWEEDWCYMKSHAGQPIKALVKDFIEFENVARLDRRPDANLRRIIRAIDSPRTARNLLNNMVTLHRLGILHRDINSSNVAKGLFLDFSTSWTKPHPCLDTNQIESSKDPYDQLGITDAYDVDEMIQHWNEHHPPKLHVWFRAATNKKYLMRLRSHAKKGKSPNTEKWDWSRYYGGRPDLYKWEPEGPDAKQRKLDSRRYFCSRKKQARQNKRKKD